jgi:hypothetical protein
MATVPTKSAGIRVSRKKLRRRKTERQQQKLLFCVITGVILLCILLYPVAIFVANSYDDAEREPLVPEHMAR